MRSLYTALTWQFGPYLENIKQSRPNFQAKKAVFRLSLDGITFFHYYTIQRRCQFVYIRDLGVWFLGIDFFGIPTKATMWHYLQTAQDNPPRPKFLTICQVTSLEQYEPLHGLGCSMRSVYTALTCQFGPYLENIKQSRPNFEAKRPYFDFLLMKSRSHTSTRWKQSSNLSASGT